MALSHTVETILCIMLAVHRLYTPLYTFNVTGVNVERVDDSKRIDEARHCRHRRNSAALSSAK
jgi:hypothetical protein